MTKLLQRLIRPTLLAGLIAATATPAWANKVEERLARIEQLLSSGPLTEMVNQQEQFRQSIQDLRGEIELLRRDLDEVKQRQRELYVDLDRRLRQLETAPAPAAQVPPVVPPATAQTPAAKPPVAPPATQQAALPTTGDEFNDYQAAFGILKAGRYAQAADAFQAFLTRYPKGQYAANALYWLGESYYVVRDFQKAQPNFQRVLDEYPDNPKRADALLKIGFIHFELGDQARAKVILEKVKKDFPDSAAAALAEQRLLRMNAR